MTVSPYGVHWDFSQDVFLSLVIPAYNQENEVKNCLRKIKETLDNTRFKYELIVVNDGSTDETLKQLRDAKNSFPNLKIISYQNNKGKGYAIKKGILETSGDVVIFLDGDLDINSNCIIKYINELADCDLVIASKAHPNSKVDCPILRRLLSRAFNFFVRTFTGIKLRDTQCGLKVARGDALRKIFEIILVKRYAFDVELLTIANILNLKIKEMPIEMSIRRSFKFKDIAKMFWDVLAISYRLRIKHYYHKQLLLMRQKNIVSQSSTRIKTMLHEKIEMKVNMKKKNVVTLALSIIIIGIIFSPYPGIEAVTILITDLTFSPVDPLDFKIIVRDPAAIVFPGPETAETLLSSNVIRVTTDPGTASEKVAFFDLACNELPGDSIGVCTFNGVVTEPTPGSLYGFSYGNFYGYGYGFFSSLYGYGTIGTGVYGYGLTANVANQDVAGLYTLSIIGSPASIRIDVLESTEATDFFTTGVLTIASGASEGDTFEDDVTFEADAEITGGTFENTVTFEADAEITGGTFENTVTFEEDVEVGGATFQGEVTFDPDATTTFTDDSTFAGGVTATGDLDFGTTSNTFDGTSTFAGVTFGTSQTWSDTATITFGTTTDVISFTGDQDFGTSTNTFAGDVKFFDGATFDASQIWTGVIKLGNALADVFSFSDVQDFSPGTLDFKGAMTFTATPIFASGQSFDGSMTFTGLSADNMETMMGSDKNLRFSGAVTFPPVPIDFPLGTEFDTPFTIPAASTFAAGVALPPLQSFPAGLTFSSGVLFGATPTFADITNLVAGMTIPADAVFTPGQTPPANLLLGSGLVLTPIECPDAACVLPDANILSPGEFFTSSASITGIKQGIESSNLNSPTTISYPGIGFSLGLTPTSTGSLSLDVFGTDAFSALSATASANGQATFSSGSSSITTVSPILDVDISDLVGVGTTPTITLTYDESNFPSGTSESDAVIFVFTGGVWQQATGCTVNAGDNTVTCTLPAGSLD